MNARRIALGSLALIAACAAGAFYGVVGGSAGAAPPGPAGTIPWTELTEEDALTAALVMRTVVDGRTIFYPAPPKERAAALTSLAEKPDAVLASSALRHLAEAKREAGDLQGAEKAMAMWAGKTGALGWEEAARWGATYRRWRFAFFAAELALGAERSPATRPLATERITWAQAHPEIADPLRLVEERVIFFPEDASYAEEWVRALEAKDRLADAEKALKETSALPPERRAVLTADLQLAHGQKDAAAKTLTAFAVSADPLPSPAFAKELMRRMDAAGHGSVDALRARLETAYDRDALVVLELYLQGASRGDLARDLLVQTELRHEKGFDRRAFLETSRLWASIDGVPEAFRARLAAARGATPAEEREDLAALSRLALRAGARPLPWGTYNDEAYRWAARIDVTPGFFTGGLSFLLTGFEGESALADLEARRLPDRTFGTAKLLVDELAHRAAEDPLLPSLRVALMERHVERGEGAEALALLPLTEKGDAPTRADARKAALLAMRQSKRPLSEETRLWKERLQLLAPDGSRPDAGSRGGAASGEDAYASVLSEAVQRLDQRDPKHSTSLALLLGELDRLPEAESVWVFAAGKAESWNLDEALEARYRKALDAFGGPEWWNRLARWYTRRKRQGELKSLADEIVARFRGTELFARDPKVSGVVAVEGQPNPFIQVSDYLRLAALRRFPWSPLVVREAEARLVARTRFGSMTPTERKKNATKGAVDEALLASRQDAVIYADAAHRSRLLDGLMRERRLEAFLLALEKSPEKTPVRDRLLLDGWARLSRFEEAAPFADRLAEAYPGDADVAKDAATIHRSLSALDPSHAAAVERVTDAAAPALEAPRESLVALGETWQDLDRPEPAGRAWRRVVEESPRDASAVLEIATVFWDYGRMREAFDVLSQGRERLARPRMHAFEAGVLREELHDLPGALDEYLAATRGEGEGDGAGEWRARDRLARLVARPRVEELLTRRIEKLAPGRREDEDAFLALAGILTLAPEEPCTCDDWIDFWNDPVGLEGRVAHRVAVIPKEETAITRLGRLLFGKAMQLVPGATRPEFLASLRGKKDVLADRRWAAEPAQDVTLEAALLSREAALAPDAEGRVEKEIALADYLVKHERVEAARSLWQSLPQRIEKLPEGAGRIRALVGEARFAEATGGDAAGSWARLSARSPRSLGVLEDRLEFLFRTSRTKEGLDVLEEAASHAASGHKENLTERLSKESLDRGDLARGKRALAALLALKLPDERRVATAGLLARISFKEGGAFDAPALGRAEAAKVREDLRADLWVAVAEAARDEGKPALAVDLLIESLNLRLDRFRLEEAARLAVSAGTEAHLLRFFDAQKKRSPRDVRWAVAVREIQTFAGDLAAAIEAAKEATLVAPEKESLQEEAVQLFLRAGRARDAADFLETWQAPRKGDEKAAGWRASLYVKAGDPARALAVERASIEAWKAGAARTEEEVAERAARTARRFVALNRAKEAWELAVPRGDLAASRSVPLTHEERVQLAIRTDHLVALVDAYWDDQDFRSQAPSAIDRFAKPEQKAELERAFLARVFPSGGRDEAALDSVWDFARQAGLHRLGEAVARRLVSSPTRPWGENPPAAFVQMLTPVVGAPGNGVSQQRWVFSREDFRKEWSQYLVSRDRLLVLEKLLAPLVQDLDAKIAAEGRPKPAPWARWFPVEAFARIAAGPGHETWRGSVKRWLATDAAYRKLQDATESRWDIKPLVELVDEETRAAFLARIAPKPAVSREAPPDPLLARRETARAHVASSLAALVAGLPGAVASQDIVRLRGPRTVGEVLSDDSRFTWAMFLPRGGEAGEDAVTGSGADKGRFPGRLWGARPGEAWYVLEALARLRETDPLAPLVPLEVPVRGRETERTLLAVRAAQALDEWPLALALDEEWFADLGDLSRLARRLHLLVEAGRRGPAEELFAKEVRSRQARLKREDWLLLVAIAEDETLPAPLSVLDAKKPVSAGLLAYLVERDADVARYRPTDEAGFRAALAELWYAETETLSPAKTARYLDELWAAGSARYPEKAARRLGPWFQRAEGFLAPLDARVRAEGLAAVRALPDPKLLAAFAEKHADRRDETERLLAAAELASGDDAAALKRLDRAMTEIVYEAPPVPRPASEEEGDGDPPAEPEPAAEPRTDAPRLTAWLRTFRASTRADAIRQAEARLAARVKKDLDAGPAGFATWSLHLELATSPEALARAVADLDRSFARGEWNVDSERVRVVRALVPRDKVAARRWFDRLDEPTSFAGTDLRASLLVELGDKDAARREWETARARLLFTSREEMRAFDEWRRLPEGKPGEAAPAWTAARRFWTLPADGTDAWGAELAAHLVKSPYDALAARAVLRSLAPAREAWIAPAAAALGVRDNVTAWRVVRAELPRSARAAKAAIPERGIYVPDLVRRRFKRAEIDGLLVDVARIAAATADRELLTSTLSSLTERRFAGVTALRAELGADVLKAGPKPETVRKENGRLVPLLPRDLTWDLYARVLNAEGVR